jgi:hypothetical protein
MIYKKIELEHVDLIIEQDNDFIYFWQEQEGFKGIIENGGEVTNYPKLPEYLIDYLFHDGTPSEREVNNTILDLTDNLEIWKYDASSPFFRLQNFTLKYEAMRQRTFNYSSRYVEENDYAERPFNRYSIINKMGDLIEQIDLDEKVKFILEHSYDFKYDDLTIERVYDQNRGRVYFAFKKTDPESQEQFNHMKTIIEGNVWKHTMQDKQGNYLDSENGYVGSMESFEEIILPNAKELSEEIKQKMETSA